MCHVNQHLHVHLCKLIWRNDDEGKVTVNLCITLAGIRKNTFYIDKWILLKVVFFCWNKMVISYYTSIYMCNHFMENEGMNSPFALFLCWKYWKKSNEWSSMYIQYKDVYLGIYMIYLPLHFECQLHYWASSRARVNIG